MIFLLINLLIFLSFYSFSFSLNIKDLKTRLILSGLFFSIQILMTQMLLGVTGLLYLSALIALNVLLAIIFVTLGIHLKKDIINDIRADILALKNFMSAIACPQNTILIAFFLFMGLWYFLAAYFFPPRGVDDLTYHLTPLYEYIINHKIFLLPTSLNPFVAYPQNADLFFMWSVLFFRGTIFLGLVQYFFALGGILILYALARLLDIDRKISFFVAIQFFFVPVILAQAGSTYIDIITTVFFLLSLYCACLFYRERRVLFFYTLAMATGMMVGMKYSMLILALPLQIFILPQIAKIGWKRLAVYLGLILILGGYWYGRNFLELGNPLFPMNVFSRSLGVFDVQDKPLNAIEFLMEIPRKFWLLFRSDPGLRSLHGGLGITFWGIAFPCWLFVFFRALFSGHQRGGRLFALLFWGQMIFGFILLFLVPIENYRLNVRYALFIVPIGLLAIGKILSLINPRKLFKNAIMFSCIIFSFLSIIQLAAVRIPSYAIGAPVQDSIEKKNVSKSKYLRHSSYMPSLSYAWELLDLLTKDDKQGLSCYMAANGYAFWTAPVYGSHLQNRVWNLQKNPPNEPDAFMYYFNYKVSGAPIRYVGKKIPLEEILLNENYTPVIFLGGNESKMAFLLKKDFINQGTKIALLKQYYQNTHPGWIKKLLELSPVFRPGIPILAPLNDGNPLKILELTQKIRNDVYLVPGHWLEDFVEKKEFKQVYTFGNPLSGFRSEQVYRQVKNNVEIIIYLNSKK